MKRYWYFYLCAAVLLICCSVLPDVVYNSVPEVTAQKITTSDFDIFKTVSGKVVCGNQVSVPAEHFIAVDEFLISEGDYVNKGDKLLKVDKTLSKQNYLLAGIPDFEKCSDIQQYVYSPCDGYIEDINKSPTYSEGDLICTVNETSSLCVVAQINERYLQDISIDQAAIINCSALKSRPYSGRVSAIASSVDAIAGNTVETVIEIDSPDSYLKNGYSANININTDTIVDAVCIPAVTIYQDEKNNEYVYVYSNGIAIKRYVETQYTNGVTTVVSSGIYDGEYIITSEVDFVQSAVNVVCEVKE